MTLKSIFARFKWKISFTLFLVALEAVLWVLFPLFIGRSIDGLLHDDKTALYHLAILGMCQLVTSALRRYYDTRVYSGIFEKISVETIQSSTKLKTTTLSARVSMIRELVDFFEDSFPGMVMSVINLVGTLVLLFTLSHNVFLGCFVLMVLIAIVFGLSSKRTVSYNHHYNNALEEQVDVIERRDTQEVPRYMNGLMRWNIKLSDLETLNFAIVWFGVISLIVFAVLDATQDSAIEHGAVLSMVMYVFQFAEETFAIPMQYQQWLRLREISDRLAREN